MLLSGAELSRAQRELVCCRDACLGLKRMETELMWGFACSLLAMDTGQCVFKAAYRRYMESLRESTSRKSECLIL